MSWLVPKARSTSITASATPGLPGVQHRRCAGMVFFHHRQAVAAEDDPVRLGLARDQRFAETGNRLHDDPVLVPGKRVHAEGDPGEGRFDHPLDHDRHRRGAFVPGVRSVRERRFRPRGRVHRIDG